MEKDTKRDCTGMRKENQSHAARFRSGMMTGKMGGTFVWLTFPEK